MSIRIILYLGYIILGSSLFFTNYAHDSPQQLLDVFNAARAKVGVHILSWNTKIADYERNFLSRRFCNISFPGPFHSGGPYSENFVWCQGPLPIVAASTGWFIDEGKYDPINKTCPKEHPCPDYSNIVSPDSRYLGCGVLVCNNDMGFIIMCGFYPPSKSPQQPEVYIPDAVPPNLYLPPIPSPNSGSLHKRKKTGLVAGIIAGGAALTIVLGIISFVVRRKKKPNETDSISDVPFDDQFENGMNPQNFSYQELAAATKNFEKKEKLGHGGFGEVYKGFLRDSNSFVAVKRISSGSRQGNKQFVAEIKIISRLRHRNTVKLLGWSHEKELMLVYEFMPNGSLDTHLFKGKSILAWEVRYKIVKGLASALFYLQEEGDQCVLHRDIKSSNIMLDSEFNAKLGDFGLAKLVNNVNAPQTSVAGGTLGYMAFEYIRTSKASKDSDIYSFGIVALEIACGRSIHDQTGELSDIFLVDWVWEAYGGKTLHDIADKKLCNNFDRNQIETLMTVGLWCAHPDPHRRPSIRQVIQVLNFESALPTLPPKTPVANYVVPNAPTARSSSLRSSMSLTIPRS